MHNPPAEIDFYIGDILYDGFDTGCLLYLPLECALDDIKPSYEFDDTAIVTVNDEMVSRVWYTLQPGDRVRIMVRREGSERESRPESNDIDSTFDDAGEMSDHLPTSQMADSTETENTAKKAWLNLREAAAYLGVSEKQLRNRCRKQTIQHRREGQQGRSRAGQYRFRKEWLDNYLASMTSVPKYTPNPKEKPRRPGVSVKAFIPESEWGSSVDSLGDN
jgi:hypothetical protein